MAVLARELFVDENGNLVDDGYVSFWHTKTGEIVRVSIFWGLLLLFFLYAIIGNLHAKRRIKKGLAPLRYHRWLLSRQDRIQYDPSYQEPVPIYYPTQGYMMAPMYHPGVPPPTYQPPPGATKVDPSQWRAEPVQRSTDQDTMDVPPSVGPPPSALRR